MVKISSIFVAFLENMNFIIIFYNLKFSEMIPNFLSSLPKWTKGLEHFYSGFRSTLAVFIHH